jgi:hypothetical protein
MLIPIHAKSDRSLGYGTASPRELVAAAARIGLPALALTDLETLAGQVEFHVACASRCRRCRARAEAARCETRRSRSVSTTSSTSRCAAKTRWSSYDRLRIFAISSCASDLRSASWSRW